MQDLLNPKQKLFVAAVIAGASLAEAAKKAGYSAHSAKRQGTRLASYATVSHALAEAQGRIAQAAELTANDCIVMLRAAYEAALAADPVQAHAAGTCVLGMAKLAGLVVDRSEATVLHKPAPHAGAAIELSEDEWKRQFAPK